MTQARRHGYATLLTIGFVTEAFRLHDLSQLEHNPMKIASFALTLSLVCALLPSSPALAGDQTALAADANPCAADKFRGKHAKANLKACRDKQRAQEQARAAMTREEQTREEVEAMRRDLSERCAQDPRSCAARQAELGERLQSRWRDQQGEGHAAH